MPFCSVNGAHFHRQAIVDCPRFLTFNSGPAKQLLYKILHTRTLSFSSWTLTSIFPTEELHCSKKYSHQPPYCAGPAMKGEIFACWGYLHIMRRLKQAILTSRGMKAGISVLEISLPASTSCAAAAKIVRLLFTLLAAVQGLFRRLPPMQRGALQRPKRDTRPLCPEKTVVGSRVIWEMTRLPIRQTRYRFLRRRMPKQPCKILIGRHPQEYHHTSRRLLCIASPFVLSCHLGPSCTCLVIEFSFH